MTKATKQTKQGTKKATSKPTALDLKVQKVKTGVRAGRVRKEADQK